MKKTYSFWVWLLCLLLPVISHAQFDPTRVYALVNAGSSKSIEVGGDNRYRSGHELNTWPYWGGANQQWRLISIGGNAYTIQNRNSGQVITRRSYVGYGVPLTQSAYTGSVYQQWTITDLNNGTWEIAPLNLPNILLEGTLEKINPDPDLILDGRPTSTPTGNYNPKQPLTYKWYISDVSASTAGVFRIMNYNSGKALSANADDTRVTQWPMWYLAGQEWTFTDYNADGYLSIINRNTNQVLEMGGGGDITQPGRNANLWNGAGNYAQQWRLVDVNNGNLLTVQDISTTGVRCQIVNRASGLVLEIGGDANEQNQDDRAANQWYDWNGPNQQWNIYIDSNYRMANGSASPSSSTGTVTATSTAVSNLASSTFTLYPNPASTTLQLTLPGNSEAFQVTIIDARGRTMSVPHQHGKVDVSNLAAGLYIVSAANGKKTFRQKFTKE